MKKRILFAVSLICFIGGLLYGFKAADDSISKITQAMDEDSIARRKVLHIVFSTGGTCTGEMIITSRRNKFALTAYHCLEGHQYPYVLASTSDGRVVQLDILDVNVPEDLVLLSGLPDEAAFEIAPSLPANLRFIQWPTTLVYRPIARTGCTYARRL